MIRTIKIQIPVDRSVLPLRRSMHVNLTLDHEQSQSAKRITEGLRQSHAQLKCGRHVETTLDAVRWLFELVAE